MGAVVGVVGGQKLGVVVEMGGQLHPGRSETPGHGRIHIGLANICGVKLIHDFNLLFKFLFLTKRRVFLVAMWQEFAFYLAVGYRVGGILWKVAALTILFK